MLSQKFLLERQLFWDWLVFATGIRLDGSLKRKAAAFKRWMVAERGLGTNIRSFPCLSLVVEHGVI